MRFTLISIIIVHFKTMKEALSEFIKIIKFDSFYLKDDGLMH